MARVFIMPDGNFSVWGVAFDSLTPDNSWILIAQFDEQLHPALFQQMSDNTSKMLWNSAGRELSLNGAILINGAWIDEQDASRAATVAEKQAGAELVTAFSYMRQHLNALKPIQLKLLGYIKTYGNDPDSFGLEQLNTVYNELKTEFNKSPYWQKRLRLFIRRRAMAQGLTLLNVTSLFSRIATNTETLQDKALIWDAAETLIAQATTAALIAKMSI